MIHKGVDMPDDEKSRGSSSRDSMVVQTDDVWELLPNAWAMMLLGMVPPKGKKGGKKKGGKKKGKKRPPKKGGKKKGGKKKGGRKERKGAERKEKYRKRRGRRGRKSPKRAVS